MQIVFLIPEYFAWHYTTALRLTLNIVTNFLWFAYHFFSIPVLWRTIFSPWQLSRAENRIYARYATDANHTLAVGSLFGETVAQIFGSIVRILVLLFGVVICVAIVVVGAVLFVIWFFLPLIVIGFVLLALKNFFV